MIDMKQAVQIAKEKALEMLGTPANLEEIDRETYRFADVWSITLSLPQYVRSSSPIAQLADPLQYKRFLIDAETGELIAIKLREVASQ
jgi:hypothetical protein